MNEWFDEVWAAMGKELGERPRRGVLRVEETRVEDAEALRGEIASFEGSGWVCFTDRVDDRRAGAALGDGVVLSAELVADGESLHVRQREPGWSVRRIRCDDDGDGLIFVEKRARIPRGQLIYEVGWEDDDDGVLRPRVARLVDVEDE